MPNGTLLLDLFHAKLSPERYWRDARSKEAGEEDCGYLLLLDLFHAKLSLEKSYWRGPRFQER